MAAFPVSAGPEVAANWSSPRFATFLFDAIEARACVRSCGYRGLPLYAAFPAGVGPVAGKNPPPASAACAGLSTVFASGPMPTLVLRLVIAIRGPGLVARVPQGMEIVSALEICDALASTSCTPGSPGLQLGFGPCKVPLIVQVSSLVDLLVADKSGGKSRW